MSGVPFFIAVKSIEPTFLKWLNGYCNSIEKYTLLAKNVYDI